MRGIRIFLALLMVTPALALLPPDATAVGSDSGLRFCAQTQFNEVPDTPCGVAGVCTLRPEYPGPMPLPGALPVQQDGSNVLTWLPWLPLQPYPVGAGYWYRTGICASLGVDATGSLGPVTQRVRP